MTPETPLAYCRQHCRDPAQPDERFRNLWGIKTSAWFMKRNQLMTDTLSAVRAARAGSMPLARAHDFLRLRSPAGLILDSSAPEWLAASLARAPWVVVRRGQILDGIIPIEARGAIKTQRLAALVSIRDVAYRSTPEELSARRAEPWRAAQAPALSALARVARVLARLGESWGPTGSVAFELATGLPVASRSSDLDLILRREESPGAHEAAELLEDLVQVASPARLDAVIETAQGGVSLADLAVGSRCLFKARRR